jgi:nicotinamidase-related amidase
MEKIVHAVHLCVDMQNIFARGGIWETPWMERVLPTIEPVAARYRERTIFSRFVTPQRPEDRRGRWQCHFRRWEQATRVNLRGDELDLVPALGRYVPPALVIDKPGCSTLMQSRLHELLTERDVRTIAITGAETDVCVLATALSAIDLGFRVVIVEDALCSSSDEGHEALMTMYRTRLHEQLDVVTAEELFDLWPRE